MKKLFLISTIFLTACAAPLQPNEVKQDPKLKSIAETVYTKLYQYGANPIPLEKISFAVVPKLDNNILANCVTYANGSRTINFSQRTLEVNSITVLEGVMLHELGHCALNLEHDDSTIVDVDSGFIIPKSIMHTYFYPQYWTLYTNYYYNEITNK